MGIYSDTIKLSSPVSSNAEQQCPILEKHWPDFAQAAAHDAFGKHWVHPADRDFTDRPPPGAPAAVKLKPVETLDIVAALRKRRAA